MIKALYCEKVSCKSLWERQLIYLNIGLCHVVEDTLNDEGITRVELEYCKKVLKWL